MRTFVANDDEGLQAVIAAATPADTIHTCFSPGGHYPRLWVQAGRWAVMSWSATDTNGRWTCGREGQVEHRPSPPDPDSFTYPRTAA